VGHDKGSLCRSTGRKGEGSEGAKVRKKEKKNRPVPNGSLANPSMFDQLLCLRLKLICVIVCMPLIIYWGISIR